MRFLIKYGPLPILFLMGFAMSSDAFRFRFSVDLSFVIIAGIVAYYMFIYKHRMRGGLSYAWWFYLLVVPTFAMTMLEGGDMQKMLCSTIALMLPFALEPFVPGNDNQTIKGFYLTFIASTVVLLLYTNFDFLSRWNPNGIAYLVYLGIAGVAVILSENRKNIAVWMLLAYVFIQLMVTQSRNAVFAMILVVFLVMFKKTFSRKIPYMMMCMFGLLYPVIFPVLANRVSKGTPVYVLLHFITENAFEKNSVFSGRNVLYLEAEKLLDSSIINDLFGFGNPITEVLSVHNDYYTIRYVYGIIGTVIIGVLFVIFFKKAFILIHEGDNITFGCVAVIIGVLFQQASEGWFIATPLPILMAFVYMAIVIKRYRISEGEHLKK